MRGLNTSAERDPDLPEPRSTSVADLVVRVTGPDAGGAAARAQALRALAVALGGAARRAGALAVSSGRFLADQVVEVAPRIPVRDLATLKEHYDGLTGDELAAALVTSAGRATAAVGAGAGALAAVEFSAPPLLLTAPVQLLAETLAVVAVELKLVAELHVVYHREPRGPLRERGLVYALSWARRRAVDPGTGGGAVATLTGAARRELRTRLMRRAGRNMASFAPFLTGAVAGAELNRRETRKLGETLIRDLR